MKIQLVHDDETILLLRPRNGADEMLISKMLRSFRDGGYILVYDQHGTELLSYQTTPAENEAKPEIDQYISCFDH